MTIDTVQFVLTCGRITIFVAKMETELSKRRHGDGLKPLTRRLFDVLVLSLGGFTTTEISVMLREKSHTISQRKLFIRAALDIRSDLELGLLAYERGWVSLEIK